MASIDFSEVNFDKEVLESTQPVLVDFWAPWCGPCRSIAPIIDELAQEYGHKVKIGRVNVDDNHALAARFGVMSIPTLLFFKNGKVEGQVVGYTPKAVLADKLDALL